MASKFVVSAKRTIRRKDGAFFTEGSEVSADTLGLDRKAFDSLIKDGVVTEESSKRKAAEPKEPESPPEGEGE